MRKIQVNRIKHNHVLHGLPVENFTNLRPAYVGDNKTSIKVAKLVKAVETAAEQNCKNSKINL